MQHHSGAGGCTGMLIPYCVSVAALSLGAAGRKFSHYEVLSGPDTHHRKHTGWWDMHVLGE